MNPRTIRSPLIGGQRVEDVEDQSDRSNQKERIKISNQYKGLGIRQVNSR